MQVINSKITSSSTKHPSKSTYQNLDLKRLFLSRLFFELNLQNLIVFLKDLVFFHAFLHSATTNLSKLKLFSMTTPRNFCSLHSQICVFLL